MSAYYQSKETYVGNKTHEYTLFKKKQQKYIHLVYETTNSIICFSMNLLMYFL